MVRVLMAKYGGALCYPPTLVLTTGSSFSAMPVMHGFFIRHRVLMSDAAADMMFCFLFQTQCVS